VVEELEQLGRPALPGEVHGDRHDPRLLLRRQW
jgi:hypothetical protein